MPIDLITLFAVFLLFQSALFLHTWLSPRRVEQIKRDTEQLQEFLTGKKIPRKPGRRRLYQKNNIINRYLL